MRQPIWAINSSLFFVFLLGQGMFFMLETTLPRRVSLEPGSVKVQESSTAVAVDIKTICDESDLFGTFVSKVVMPKQPDMLIPQIPEVPTLIPLSVPVEPQKIVIPPLPVSLKGVIYLYDQPSKSVAIVQFQDSKEEINYRVGQLIHDAQILKICPDSIVVVRSNGQQETLYLSETDLSMDTRLESAKNLTELVIQNKQGIYQVPVEKFIGYVKNLGNFIDLLDLTTVYQKGKSFGCRVGKAQKDSLGSKLGLTGDDVITQIDGLPVTDIASRVLIFDHIVEKKIGDAIIVQIERHGSPVSLHYVLIKGAGDRPVAQVKSSLSDTPKGKDVVESSKLTDERKIYDIEEQRQKMFEKKIKMAPTAYQIEMEERRKMFAARRDSMLAKHNQNMVDMQNFTVPNQVNTRA